MNKMRKKKQWGKLAGTMALGALKGASLVAGSPGGLMAGSYLSGKQKQKEILYKKASPTNSEEMFLAK
jgi:hypothetical protein